MNKYNTEVSKLKENNRDEALLNMLKENQEIEKTLQELKNKDKSELKLKEEESQKLVSSADGNGANNHTMSLLTFCIMIILEAFKTNSILVVSVAFVT